MKSCVGVIPITEKQAKHLDLPPHSQISPLLEKCCLRLTANESYQNTEAESEALTGIKVGHTTLHRLVQRTEFSVTDAKGAVTEVSVDGGKVRLRDYEANSETVAGIQGSAPPRNLLQCCF